MSASASGDAPPASQTLVRELTMRYGKVTPDEVLVFLAEVTNDAFDARRVSNSFTKFGVGSSRDTNLVAFKIQVREERAFHELTIFFYDDIKMETSTAHMRWVLYHYNESGWKNPALFRDMFQSPVTSLVFTYVFSEELEKMVPSFTTEGGKTVILNQTLRDYQLTLVRMGMPANEARLRADEYAADDAYFFFNPHRIPYFPRYSYDSQTIDWDYTQGGEVQEFSRNQPMRSYTSLRPYEAPPEDEGSEPPKTQRPRVGGCAICKRDAKFRCIGCGIETYCSDVCQRAGWDSGHGDVCGQKK